MTGQTKKQKSALELAAHIIEYEPETLKSREWQNLFENGFNNTNALLIGLMQMIDSRPGFYREILSNKEYMPSLLVSYATYKAGESEQEGKQAEMLETIEELAAATDKILKYESPFDKMTPDKWERLYEYNIKPLFEVLA